MLDAAALSDSGGAAGFATAPPDATMAEDGLAWKVLVPGAEHIHPGRHDRVRVNYTGWSADGKSFASTDKQGKPAIFAMAGLIAGWVQGVELMTRGEKRRFWMPARLAYGEQTIDPAYPAGPLVYDIELLEILPLAEPPAVPPDLTPVPKTAKRTRTGLAYRFLAHGAGKQHPRPTSTVDVQFIGWRANGRVIDSSFVRGLPARFSLSNVIKGWQEGLQLMVVGDRARFWIPPQLVSSSWVPPAGANGMVVFDVELLDIVQ